MPRTRGYRLYHRKPPFSDFRFQRRLSETFPVIFAQISWKMISFGNKSLVTDAILNCDVTLRLLFPIVTAIVLSICKYVESALNLESNLKDISRARRSERHSGSHRVSERSVCQQTPLLQWHTTACLFVLIQSVTESPHIFVVYRHPCGGPGA